MFDWTPDFNPTRNSHLAKNISARNVPVETDATASSSQNLEVPNQAVQPAAFVSLGKSRDAADTYTKGEKPQNPVPYELSPRARQAMQKIYSHVSSSGTGYNSAPSHDGSLQRPVMVEQIGARMKGIGNALPDPPEDSGMATFVKDQEGVDEKRRIFEKYATNAEITSGGALESQGTMFIDRSPGQTPEQSIRKAEQLRAESLSGEYSAEQRRSLGLSAYAMDVEARQEVMKKKMEELTTFRKKRKSLQNMVSA